LLIARLYSCCQHDDLYSVAKEWETNTVRAYLDETAPAEFRAQAERSLLFVEVGRQFSLCCMCVLAGCQMAAKALTTICNPPRSTLRTTPAVRPGRPSQANLLFLQDRVLPPPPPLKLAKQGKLLENGVLTEGDEPVPEEDRKTLQRIVLASTKSEPSSFLSCLVGLLLPILNQSLLAGFLSRDVHAALCLTDKQFEAIVAEVTELSKSDPHPDWCVPSC